MMKWLLILLITIYSNASFSQSDTLILSIKLEGDKIAANNDVNLSITLVNLTKSPVQIPNSPSLTNYDTEFGHVRFKLEKIEDKCFANLEVHMDPIYFNSKRDLRKLEYQDTVQYVYDLSSIFSISEGFYRVKVYHSYILNENDFEVNSKWLYFEVTK